jgi:molybdopterin molybdotransferase
LHTVEEAFHIIKECMPDFGHASVHLGERTLARLCEDLVADRDYPPFDRVMMDGIAVLFRSLESGQVAFAIEGVAAAGEPQKSLQNSNACMEVMTGTPLPNGCDLVIPYEDLRIENGVAHLQAPSKFKTYANIHRAGSDCKSGDSLLAQGHALNGPRWGIAASVGKTELKVARSPRILIVSTGDELVHVAETPRPHQLRRSNVHALEASLRLHDYSDITLAHLNDDAASIKAHYQENASRFDVMIYSGGVSKGKFDYLPNTFKACGVTELLHGVSQRPGKPLWFGIDRTNKTRVFGLPGNPVSSLVCLHRYFLETRPLYAQLDADFSFDKKLTYFVPVTIAAQANGTLVASPLKIKNSGEFTALALSDGFIELPMEQDHFRKGEAFRFFAWSGL